MLDYIKNLLPRLKKYSKDLDKIENFVDKKWRFIDSSNQTLSIIFLKDNRVIISKVENGTDQKTIEGSWELLPTNQLYLKRPEPILLEQGFIGQGILIFQESGTNNLPICCYDSTKIKPENIGYHLDVFLQDKENPRIPYPEPVIIPERTSKERLHNIRIFNTNKGLIRIKKTCACSWSTFIPEIQDEVFVENDLHAADGNYILKNADFNIVFMRISNGRVNNIIKIIHFILFVLFALIVLALITVFWLSYF